MSEGLRYLSPRDELYSARMLYAVECCLDDYNVFTIEQLAPSLLGIPFATLFFDVSISAENP
jgi:hypothetical protein